MASPDDKWACDTCTYINNPLFLTCEMCQTAKDIAPPEVAPPSQPERPPTPDPQPPAEPDLVNPEEISVEDQQVAEYISTHLGSEVSPLHIPGISNLTRKHLNMEKVVLHNHQWLLNDHFRDVVVKSATKAQNSCGLLQHMVSLSLEEERNVLEARCGRCDQEARNVGVLHINGCGHAHCGLCVRDYTLDLVKKLSCINMKCPFPDCDSELQNDIIQQSLMPKEYGEYVDATMATFVRQDSSIITCPNEKCGSVMNFDKRQKANIPHKIIAKTDDGKLFEREAWVHYNTYRLRCRECKGDLCAGCKTMPYHSGFTCEGFKEYGASRHCRFCAAQLKPGKIAPQNGIPALADVCSEQECLERREQCCEVMLDCGHPCGGVKEEKEHISCLMDDCPARDIPQSGSDLCNICWVEGLESAPSIKLKCSHIFHRHCVITKLESKWPSVRITFGFLKCPLCPAHMDHPSLADNRKEAADLFDKIKAKSLFRLKVDGLENDDKLINPKSKWFGNKVEFAMNSFAYYNCFKCAQAYFGGRRDCEQNADAEKRPRNEFICFDCADIKQIACKNADHKEFHVYKCRFCCSVAVWFCWGTTHFCEPCHSDRPWERAKWSRDKFKQCKGKEYCSLKVDHSPNGSEQECEASLGCGMCLDDIRKQEDEAKKEKEIDDELSGKKPVKKPKRRPKKKSGFFGVF